MIINISNNVPISVQKSIPYKAQNSLQKNVWNSTRNFPRFRARNYVWKTSDITSDLSMSTSVINVSVDVNDHDLCDSTFGY